MTLEWKFLSDFPGYAITWWGEIFSVPRVVDIARNRWNSKSKQLINGRILQKGLGGSGYYAVGICVNGKKSPVMVHRLVAKEFVPNPDGKPQVNHKDGNRLNNKADNLEWVTSSENNLHTYKTGRRPSGAAHHFAKLPRDKNGFCLKSKTEGSPCKNPHPKK